MSNPSRENPGSNRRDFLTGRAVRHEMEKRGAELADELAGEQSAHPPSAGETVRLTTQAMNCEFSVILNPSQQRGPLIRASDALDRVHTVESQLTVYRPTSDLLQINDQAAEQQVTVEAALFELLQKALQIAHETNGAFNPCARALNALWRTCRQQSRLPEEQELAEALHNSDYHEVLMDDQAQSVAFLRQGIGFDLGGMGKGYALDDMASSLAQEQVHDFLIHGGHSSILAHGAHQQIAGWPVGIRHPLFPQKRLATLVLQDRGFSASGSGVQHFRYQGKRYGHIFDPRTGWPVEQMLSVAVTAPTAAVADALSTAFFVMTEAESVAYCQQHPEIGAILIPPPPAGKPLQPIVINLDPSLIYWS